MEDNKTTLTLSIYLYYIVADCLQTCSEYSTLVDENLETWFCSLKEGNEGEIDILSATKNLTEDTVISIIPLYVGQTCQGIKRDKEHFGNRNTKTRSDFNLMKIRRENMRLITLETKQLWATSSKENDQNVHEGGKWMNDRETHFIDRFDTYNNGLNNTKGGNISVSECHLHLSHKKSQKFIRDFLHHGQKYYEKHGKIGACQRDYKIDGYPLGEHLHKLRCNTYATIWSDPELVNQLDQIGYTETSKEAGVIMEERRGKNRIDNKWPYFKQMLQLLYDHFGHLNIPQREDFPANIPEELIQKINYKRAGQIISDIRQGRVLGKGEDRASRLEFLGTLKFCRSSKEWTEHNLLEALTWYYKHNVDVSHPPQSYSIPKNDDLPVYLHGFQLGGAYTRMIVSKQRPFDSAQVEDQLMKLVSKHRNAKKPTIGRHYSQHPAKKRRMKERAQASRDERDLKNPLFYKHRAWNTVLKKKFTFGYDSHYNSPVYGVSQKRIPKSGYQGLRWDPKRNAWFISWKQHNWRHKLFTVTSESIKEEKKKEALTFLQKMLVIFPKKEKKPPIKRGAHYWFSQNRISGEGIYCQRKTVSGFSSRHECYRFVRKHALGAFYFRRWYILTKLRIHRRKDQ